MIMAAIERTDANGEKWVNMQGAAAYIEKSRQGLAYAIEKYEKDTGKTIATQKEGGNTFLKYSELDDLIKELYPFLAGKRGIH